MEPAGAIEWAAVASNGSSKRVSKMITQVHIKRLTEKVLFWFTLSCLRYIFNNKKKLVGEVFMRHPVYRVSHKKSKLILKLIEL